MNDEPRARTRSAASTVLPAQRQAEHAASEYQSFVKGFTELLDEVQRWRELAQGDEAARWERLHKRSMSLLLQHGIRPTARVGAEVDVHYHEVIATETQAGAPPGSILQVVEMGYEQAHWGREPVLIRTARVIAAAAGE